MIIAFACPSSLHRPGLQGLIDRAGRGEFDIVLAEALDRLSRDQADVATLFKRLCFHDVRIVTLSEGGISELHVGLKGAMNQLFLEDLADKTRRGLRGRVEAGLSGGGNSYGYNVVRKQGPDGQTGAQGPGLQSRLDECSMAGQMDHNVNRANL